MHVAFSLLLHPFLSQPKPETMFLYYTGHGLNIEKLGKKDAESAFSFQKGYQAWGKAYYVITALTRSPRKNKHLIVIADSYSSGMLGK